MKINKKIQKWDSYHLFLLISFTSSMFFSLVFTVNLLYQVTVVHLTPLQLVLVGTILEASIFLFEIPTGILADTKSRKLSIIIGYILIGTGFVIEGYFPNFYFIAFSQALWGIGYTFISGASQAWVADEVGEERVGKAFLKGAQLEKAGDLMAIPISVLLGLATVTLPIITGGLLMIILGILLIFIMSENGFKPIPKKERNSFGSMIETVKSARTNIITQPIFLSIMGIAFFYGLYSEGFDRLWTPHLINNFSFPSYFPNSVILFGLIRAIMLIVSILVVYLTEKNMKDNHLPVTKMLILLTLFMILILIGFGLIHNIWMALILLWLFGALRSTVSPLFDIWYNEQIKNPQVRATMFSVKSLTDSIGQIAGGPFIGYIGNVISIRAAIVSAGLILSPILMLYRKAIDKSKE